MSRRRYISTDISIDKRVNRMGMKYGDSAVLLYTWMIPHATDDATLIGDPFELLGMVWPNRRDKTEQDIIDALSAMVEFGLIEWDQEERVIYLPVDSFYKHQTYIKKENRRTAQNTAQQRKSPNITDEQQEPTENTVSLSLSPSLSLSHPPPKESGGGEQAVADLDVRIQKFYEQTFSQMLNEIQVSKLSWWCEQGMEESVVFHAISLAREHGKDFGYVRGILKNQFERGIRTMAHVEEDNARRQAAPTSEKGAKRHGHGTNRSSTDDDAEWDELEERFFNRK